MNPLPTNKSGCKIGARNPDVDYDDLMADLHRFYSSFVTPITDCEVNYLLQLQSSNSKVIAILQGASKNLEVAKNLRKLQENDTWITCKECSTIGDIVVGLEQSKSWTMLHLDNSFNELCALLKLPSKQIRSVRSFEKGLHSVLNPRDRE